MMLKSNFYSRLLCVFCLVSFVKTELVKVGKMEYCENCTLVIAAAFQGLGTRLDNTSGFRTPSSVSCDHHVHDEVLLAEAMKWAIDKLNENRSPTCPKLGYIIDFDCADRQGSMLFGVQLYNRISDQEDDTLSTDDAQIAAYVGASNAINSAAIAQLFKMKHIPVVSYKSHSYSTHTIDSTHFHSTFSVRAQTRALIGLFKHFKWSYVAVVMDNSDPIYAQMATDLKTMAEQDRICFAVQVYVLQTDLKGFEEMKEKIEQSNTNITLLLAGRDTAQNALNFLQRIDSMTVIGVDAWLHSPYFYNTDHASLMSGVLGLVHRKPRLNDDEFAKYMLENYMDRAEENEWLFGLLCQKCARPPDCTWPHSHNLSQVDECQSNFTTEYLYDYIMHFSTIKSVIEAVQVLYNAIRTTVDQGNKFSHKELTENLYLMRDSEKQIVFDGNGELFEQSFNLIHFPFLNLESNNPIPLQTWRLVGNWSLKKNESEPTFYIDDSAFDWTPGAQATNTSYPRARCGPRCSPGQWRRYGGDGCCWSCEKCPINNVSARYYSDKCIACRKHYHANEERSECVPNEEIWIGASDSIGVIFFTMYFVLLAFFIAYSVFVFKFRNHPVYLKNRRTNVIHIVSLVVPSVMFIIFYSLRPTNTICAMQSFCMQLGFTCSVMSRFLTHDGLSGKYKYYIECMCQIPERLSLEVLYAFGFLFCCLLCLPIDFTQGPSVVLLERGTGLNSTDPRYGTSFRTCDFAPSTIAPLAFAIFLLYPMLRQFAKRIRHMRVEAPRSSSTIKKSLTDVDELAISGYCLYSLFVMNAIIGPFFLVNRDPDVQAILLRSLIVSTSVSYFLITTVPRVYAVYKFDPILEDEIKRERAVSIANRSSSRQHFDSVFVTQGSKILTLQRSSNNESA